MSEQSNGISVFKKMVSPKLSSQKSGYVYILIGAAFSASFLVLDNSFLTRFICWFGLILVWTGLVFAFFGEE